MANGSALEQDFIGQLLRALGQKTNFNKDLTDALSGAEAQFDNPNQFSGVFDLDERNRLREQQRDISLDSINAIQNRLDQRNQSFGDFAESVSRGRQATFDQANLDRQFGLDERRVSLAERQGAADIAGGVDGLTLDQALDNQRADLGLSLDIEKFTAGQAESARKVKSQLIADAQNARVAGVPERQIVQGLKAQGVTQKDFKSGVTFMTREIKRMKRTGSSLEEIQDFIIDNEYSPSRFGLPNPKAPSFPFGIESLPFFGKPGPG